MTILIIHAACGCSLRHGRLEFCPKHAAADTMLAACQAVRTYFELDRRQTVRRLVEDAIKLADPTSP